MASTIDPIRTVGAGLRRGSGALACLAAALLMLVGTAPALAADDPPGRVGRVTDSQGQSWYFDGEANEWINLERNRPLTTGERIAVDGGGRLELRIGSTAVRLAGGSELEIGRLDDERVDLVLHSGSVAVRVRSAEVAREVEVATVEGRFSPRGAGHFRVDRRDDGSVGTAWSGDLHFEGDDSALDIPAGRGAEFWREGANNATHYSWSELQQDEFADWTARANREDDRAAAPEYVSPEMTGAEDLNRYGRWEANPDYGPLWVPTTVVAGWAPYRYGHWAMVRPWGWTWVDDAPWGFAPFHYGRWVFFNGYWCWAPGRWVARPVYAPAMVAWINSPQRGGPWPYTGWVPLAPREPYYPHYSHGGSYWRAVNSAQMSLFPQSTPRRPPTGPVLYANQAVSGAVSVVPRDAFVPRRPVAPAVAQVDPAVRNSFANLPTRVHVPPPGLARPIAVPGVAPGAALPSPAAPPRSPRPPGQPSPPVMAQPGLAPPATAVPDGRRARVVPAPPTARTAPPPAATRPLATPPPQGHSVGNAVGNAVGNLPAQPRVGGRPQAPSPAVQPQAPAVPGVAPAPSAQPQAPAQPAAPRRVDPGEPAGARRSSSSMAPSPAARATAAPAAPAVTRAVERVAALQPAARAPQRAPGHAPPAQSRVRAPEWNGHPNRAQMR